MKHFILKIVWQLLIPVITLMFICISCIDNNDKEGENYNPNKPIVLTSFEPDSGRIRDMVLLDGNNFGTDLSLIEVFFNSSKAKVVGSTGKRILVRVPRLPGDTCILSVQIGEQKEEYMQKFRYKVAASVTTIAGNGEPSSPDNPPAWEYGLDNSRLTPVYMTVDSENNLFVSVREGYLFRINTKENTISLIATETQHGYEQRCPPYVNPYTNVLQIGAEAEDSRDKFMFMDPKEGWVPKTKYIKSWEWNGLVPPAGWNNVSHPHCLLNEDDGYYYTRYVTGLIAKINPETWHAEAIGMTPSGRALGMTFHPIKKNELWIGYWEENTAGMNNAICTVDVSDTTKYWVDSSIPGLLTSFKKQSSGIVAAGHRDGPLSSAEFALIRQINFDSQGNLFVGDAGNDCIRMINTKTMMVETVIGIPQQRGFMDGNREEALFNQPQGLVVDAEGVIYVSDWGNNRLRRVAIE